MKRVFALAALLTGVALLLAPGAGAETNTCPPGTTDNPYCVPGVKLLRRSVPASRKGLVRVPIRCTTKPRCSGRLVLVTRRPRHRRRAHRSAAGGAIAVGRAAYSLAYGRNGSVNVWLTRYGRLLLGRRGRLRVAVISATQGERTVIGHLLIRGFRRLPHNNPVTRVRTHPGFTG